MRHRVSYHTWYFLHLYTYIALALSFAHQFNTGADFATHPLNRVIWAAMYGCVAALLVAYRVGRPVANMLRHRFVVVGTVSGVVKGWSIEQASSILEAAGLPDHAIDGGGDVRLRGAPGPGRAGRVGVRHPGRREAYSAALCLGDAAVATSGTYERGAHVVNPRTGRPATELVSVTVVGPELTTTDAYATAALAMGADAPAWLAGLGGYEA